jgi:hypothetical protein
MNKTNAVEVNIQAVLPELKDPSSANTEPEVRHRAMRIREEDELWRNSANIMDNLL